MKKKDSNKTKLIKLYLYIRKGLSIHKTHDSFHTKGSTKTKHKPDDLHLFLHGDLRGDEGAGIGFLTPGLDHDARATDNLDGLTIGVVLAQTSPLTEKLGVIDLDKRSLVLVTESGDKLGVSLLVTRVGEDAQVSLTTVQSLDSLTETTGQTIVVHRDLQNLTKGRDNVQRLFDFNLLFFFNLNVRDDLFVFKIRHD